MDFQYIRANGITFHVALEGPPTGEPILFLHGFPEFWYGWRKQMHFFAEQGYRVIVPDQRGYNLTDKPAKVTDYKISTLATDVDQLIQALGYEQVHLVGHDWGGAVAWWVATMYPHRLKSLSLLNIPYPTVMLAQLRQWNFAQIRKSWYIAFIQIPSLPEFLVSRNAYRGFANAIQRTARKGTFSPEDLDKYREAWGKPKAMTSMMNWYRAMLKSESEAKSDPKLNAYTQGKKLTPPIQLLWGERDAFLGKELAQPSIDLCENGTLKFYPKATHWLQHEEPDGVNADILAFVKAHA